MRIVVLDGYAENPGDLSWGKLESLGTLFVHDRMVPDTDDEVIKRIGDAEIAVVNKARITRKVLSACPNLKFVAVMATGYNVVDTKACKERGIPVSNVPSYGTDSVSQFAMALLLELACKVGRHSDAVHEGRWQNSADWCFWDSSPIELSGKTMGILGFGRIGHRTGEIAKALKMRVLANDSYENPSFKDEGFPYVDRETLFSSSDVIVLHCPLTPETEGIINKRTISKMKGGVLIVNNARGPLIVEKDLAEALNSGKVGGAAVDVVSAEPIRADNPLLHARNCIITPHMSWGAKESRERIMDMSAENIKAFLSGKPHNVVNG